MHGSAGCAPTPQSRFSTEAAAAGIAALLLATHAPASGQTLNGTAEVNATRNVTTSNSQASHNNALGQNYTIGWTSSLVDPRLVRYNAELSLHRNSLNSSGSQQASQEGRQHDVGFRVGTSAFSSGAFPLFLEASRLRSSSGGDLAPSNPIRGAAFVPVGTAPNDFDTETRLLNVGARLNAGSLPRLEVGYRTGGSLVTGGPYRAEQHDDDLMAAASKDTASTRQSIRYQRSSFESAFPETFTHQVGNLDYDFSSLLGRGFRVTAHGGRRSTFARSPLAVPVVDTAGTPYTPPPADGRVNARYASAGLSYEPTTRLAVRVFGTYDRQTTTRVSTDALLATLSAHYEVIKGLSLDVSGTSGDRGQVLGDTLTRVATRSGTAGASYRAGARWLEGTVSAVRGIGINNSVDGRRGRSESWSREAGVSSSFKWFGLGTSYERISSVDQILDLGNYESERVRASAQAQASRFSLSLAADRLKIARRSVVEFSDTLQRTFSGTASLRFWRQNLATATAGGFSNVYGRLSGAAEDQTFYWGVGTQLSPVPALQLLAWVRSELALATSTNLDQAGLSALGRIEYRLRTLSFAAEYRDNRSRVQYASAPDPDTYRGRQIRLSVARRFAFAR